MPVPDSVRLAMPAEAVDVARLQRRAWGANPVMARALGEISADETVRAWHEAITKPPLAHLRVLVAQASGMIVGFAVTGPSNDPDAAPTDGLIAEFVVDEDSVEAGHSSRLINAAVDTLRADGYEVATIWLPSDADEKRQFLVECGWATDGAHREVGPEEGDDAGALKLLRMHTDIKKD
ncbi:GNAT family N-acetyltransferase [Tessaracoccus rhinocerotis]|uniref:GNAT family N-acetyltransferase n=1 Tax=Tessaracoccus rhinocerotis TaxID=1689449 RepID=A0A553K2S1_9ACTN|nr:GNAT family N-acetyltransferase [Tessaracoccus rhinocerotis]TRY19002.1 GNAT family N-acetyltransferase [Tessaracoccus rhinocerotis]